MNTKKAKKVQSILNVVAKIIPRLTTKNIKTDIKADKKRFNAEILQHWLQFNQLQVITDYYTCDNRKLVELGFVGLCVDVTGQLWHFKSYRDATHGKNKLKKLHPDDYKLLDNKTGGRLAVKIDAAWIVAKREFMPFTVEVKPCSMIQAVKLREWHLQFGITSCMFGSGGSDKLAEISIRFYRHAGFKIAYVVQNGKVTGRTFVDKNNHYTRIYSLDNYDRHNEKALTANGFKKVGSYNGKVYARITRDDDNVIFAPYLDGDSQCDILDNEIEAKNGKRFALLEFNGTEIKLDSTNGKKELDGCKCSECGTNINADEANYLSNGNVICCDCSSYCEECEETVLADNITTFFYRSRNGDIEEGYCCECCANNMRQVAFRN